MGLKVNRLRRINTGAFKQLSNSINSAWSARAVWMGEASDGAKASYSEKVVPDSTGHLGHDSVGNLFDRIWNRIRAGTRGIFDLDMTQVTTTDRRFERELAFLQRQEAKYGVLVRLSNWS